MPTIATKMTIGFGGMTVLMASAIGGGIWANQSAMAGFTGLLADENVTALLAVDAKAMLLEQRRSEKDFLMRKDMQYAKLVGQSGVRLLQDIDGILAVCATRHHDTLAAQAKRLRELSKDYQDNFNTVVDLAQERGLADDSGIVGQLVEAGTGLSLHLQQNAIGPVYVLILQLRTLAGDPSQERAWAQAWTSCQDGINTYAKSSRESAAVARHMRDLLAEY